MVVIGVTAAVGIGALTGSRLKASVTLVNVSVRSAFAKASALSRPVRIVFDFKDRKVWLEEGSGPMLVKDSAPLRTGGADAATENERKAVEEADKILKGPRAPRVAFKPITNPGFKVEKGNGRALENKIYFKEIHVSHQPEPMHADRSYVYFWPGGQTESAYIQLGLGNSPLDSDNRTLVIHPLTGKVETLPGLKTVPVGAPGEDSEREDPGP